MTQTRVQARRHRLGQPPIAVLLVAADAAYSSAAALFLTRGDPAAGVEVVSAGLRPDVSPRTAALLEPGPEVPAVPVTAEQIRAADLVLTLDRAQRRQVVALVPAAWPRCYTLREFARLASRVPQSALSDAAASAATRDRFAALLGLVPQHRAPAIPAEDDIADPFDRPDFVVRGVLADIWVAADTIRRVLQR